MKKNCIKLLCVLITIVTIINVCPVLSNALNDNTLNILFTHDIHDYLYPTTTLENDKIIEHGGAAKLATIIKENSDENTLFLDAGDFSMGTLFQAAYDTEAYELINLGLCGCAVTTFGNHEFDYGTKSVAKMLRTAMNSDNQLPQIVQSNIDFSGDLSDDQKELKAAFDEYGIKEHTIIECAGYKIGIFGVVGYDCIECIQTDLNYIDYIESSKAQTKALIDEGCDIVIALSHSGTSGDGENGEDFDLAKEVPDIDIIISGHSHSVYDEPVIIGDTIIVSCGEYLKNVGKLSVSYNNGKLQVNGFSLIPVDSSIAEDPEIAANIEKYKENINNTYLKDIGSFNEVIAHSNYNFESLTEMYDSHHEYPLGDLIADSYIYAAKQNGIDDIDVALVGLGTIRGSIKKGDITIADAFEICSLGVGSDGTAGHPIVSAYITGKELKLLTELDASLGTMVSSIKMSYSGLSYTFNTKRIIMDRVSKVNLINVSGQEIEIEDDKLYKVAANMYSINMLGMLNGLTKGILSITPKDKNGNPITDFYSVALLDKNGKEIKEWVAFKDYLQSFDVGPSGYPEISDNYQSEQSRKIKISQGGVAAFTNNGVATNIIPVLILCLALFIVLIIIVIAIINKIKKNRKIMKKIESQENDDLQDDLNDSNQSNTEE